jgi:acetylornithine/succinyldiaminopimelate/putrescine aminotransferase
LVFDEIQTGMGRTGSLFAFNQYMVSPDVLLLGKSLGAGLPLAALISDPAILKSFSHPMGLRYISTFGGNPLSCAAGLAGLKIVLAKNLSERAHIMGKEFKDQLEKLPFVKEIRQIGLFMALELKEPFIVWPVIQQLYEEGILVEGFLFCHNAIRITPPLVLESEHIGKAMEAFSKIG